MKKTTIKMMSIILAAALFCSTALVVHASGSFSDVQEDTWYSRAVDFSFAKGLMLGTGNGKFSPGAKVNRAMFVTILHRLAGSPESSEGNTFADVPDESYYTRAVDWAVENDVVFGTSKTTFSPGRNITREEMACMIARYAEGIHAAFLDGPCAEQSFSDQDTVSAFAKEAVDLMRKTSLFMGNEAGRFCPQADATRAEAAMVFMRLALRLNEVPSQAVLKVYDENSPNDEEKVRTYTLSAEDTVALYLILSDSVWEQGVYAEYAPTHSLTLWCGEYRFYLPRDGQGYDGVNYVNGNTYSGMCDPDGLMLPRIQGIFAKYIV